MSGAKETLRAQTANNHNLANASTTGFRADMSAFQTRAVAGSGYASRAYATNSTTGWDPTQGALTATGRDLDVGINGSGWIAVLGKDGREAYTRAGDLRVDPSGMLMTGAGLQVMGEGGPISVPPNTSRDHRFRRHDLRHSARPGRGNHGDDRSHQAGESAGRGNGSRRGRFVS